jgi:hypothetical protein
MAEGSRAPSKPAPANQGGVVRLRDGRYFVGTLMLPGSTTAQVNRIYKATLTALTHPTHADVQTLPRVLSQVSETYAGPRGEP